MDLSKMSSNSPTSIPSMSAAALPIRYTGNAASHPAATMALTEYYNHQQRFLAAELARSRNFMNPTPGSAMAQLGLPVPFAPFPYNTGAGFAPFSGAMYPSRNMYRFMPFREECPKPTHSYIGLIGMAILSSPDKKMVLSDIYQWILDHYQYFRNRAPGWKNSIRHNLSLNACFVKCGRSATGKGHYWAINPANLKDFQRGDFRRRKAQQKAHRMLGASDDHTDDEDSRSPSANDDKTTDSSFDESSESVQISEMPPSPLSEKDAAKSDLPSNPPAKRKAFDMASILAPEEHSNPEVKKAKTDQSYGTQDTIPYGYQNVPFNYTSMPLINALETNHNLNPRTITSNAITERPN